MFRKDRVFNANGEEVKVLEAEIAELKKTLRLLEAQNNEIHSKIITQLEKLSVVQNVLLKFSN